MTQVGVRKVKDRLSEYIRRVRQGERVVITDRGRPVAALVGLAPEEPGALASELVKQGLVEWGGGKPRGLADAPRIAGRRAEEVVLEDRR